MYIVRKQIGQCMRHACKWAELLNTSRHVRAHDANYIYSMTRDKYIVIYTHK